MSNEKIPENPGRRLKDDQVRESYRTLAAIAAGRSSERILQNPGSKLKDDQVRESYRTLAAG